MLLIFLSYGPLQRAFLPCQQDLCWGFETWSADRGWWIDYLLNFSAKSKIFCGIMTLQIWPYLGASICWEHSVLQTPALVDAFLSHFFFFFFFYCITVSIGETCLTVHSYRWLAKCKYPAKYRWGSSCINWKIEPDLCLLGVGQI